MRHTSSGPTAGEPAGRLPTYSATTSRAGFLRRVGSLGGTALAAGGLAVALPARARPAASVGRDATILNFVLRIESLKAAFYQEASTGGALTGELHQLAAVLGRHERAHVSFLRERLGTLAAPERIYDFGDATNDAATFAATARKLEESAVAAYIGQGPYLDPSLMVPFAQICSVEARHAAWIADLLDADPAPRPADQAEAPADVVAVIEELGFEARSS
jgi:hypothetical protein